MATRQSTLTRNVKALVQEYRVPQRALAQALGRSEGSVSHILAGRHNFRLGDLPSLLSFFRSYRSSLTADDLLGVSASRRVTRS